MIDGLSSGGCRAEGLDAIACVVYPRPRALGKVRRIQDPPFVWQAGNSYVLDSGTNREGEGLLLVVIGGAVLLVSRDIDRLVALEETTS